MHEKGVFFIIRYVILFRYQSDHTWSKNTQIINQIYSGVKDWSLNIIVNNTRLAYDLTAIKPQPCLTGHQTLQHSFLNCELLTATSLSTTDYFFRL